QPRVQLRDVLLAHEVGHVSACPSQVVPEHLPHGARADDQELRRVGDRLSHGAVWAGTIAAASFRVGAAAAARLRATSDPCRSVSGRVVRASWAVARGAADYAARIAAGSSWCSALRINLSRATGSSSPTWDASLAPGASLGARAPIGLVLAAKWPRPPRGACLRSEQRRGSELPRAAQRRDRAPQQEDRPVQPRAKPIVALVPGGIDSLALFCCCSGRRTVVSIDPICCASLAACARTTSHTAVPGRRGIGYASSA